MSLHNALQGAMVCHLRGATDLGVLKKIDAKKWLKKQNNSSVNPPHCKYLASAEELFERLYYQSKRFDDVVVPVIKITDDEKYAFGILNRDLRNELEHFKPGGCSIEIELITDTLLKMVNIIEKIRDQSRIFRKMDQCDEASFNQILKELRISLQEHKGTV